ncbi:hypothetical protein EW145_g7511 [Phellinidium pouzarii]|uniref:Uncharacterized protein n=1 Tax=Phellinidium pouzarii TaxID=167371 RepID=A0A4S4KI10_9AGAM|nr:hypothetical protein EW145_g7511 [Phellinidium pouzarii]
MLYYYYTVAIDINPEDSLWGAGTVQISYYCDKYLRINKWRTAHTLITYTLVTTHQAFVLKSVYTIFVTHFYDNSFLENLNDEFLVSTIIAALTDASAQVFFLTRIWHLSKRNKSILFLLSILVLANLAAAFVHFALSIGSPL